MERLIAIKNVIAFKILYLSKVALSHPEETYAKILTLQEWQALYMLEHKTTLLPEDPPTIKQTIIWLTGSLLLPNRLLIVAVKPGKLLLLHLALLPPSLNDLARILLRAYFF